MDINDNITQDSMIGRRVGVYELQKEIGRGGMGAVYLAGRADGEFHQTVAVKLIKRGMDTDQILKRFRRERQILARLNHPNIAYFFGGGSTGDGLPYFVMEYIKGVSLYRFCDENKLNTCERLQIFRQICDAVDAAHQIKVIHRDLKPSNILVKADGKPKLLDFGIAKVLDPEFETTESEPTATHLRVMTPEYASPEQLRGDEITPASDVYSLGVILYELLTGHRPYRLKKRAAYEVARIICEEIPSRPSGSVTSEDNLVPVFENEKEKKDERDERNERDEKKISLGSVFASRKTSPTTLRNELSGDLDRIILKTLRKNPKERYQTAAELAEDITNYLENLPVKAENFITLSPAPVSAAERKEKKKEKKKENNKQNDKHSVAILPFRMFGAARTNDTGENGDEFLSVGLADALVTRLSGVQRLVVRPTSSVLRFGRDSDSFSSGRELGVDFVVEGNIRRVGQRIRVTAQLLNVRDNSTRWSESFDELFTDVLELEDSISEKVAQSLIPQLTGEERNRLERRCCSSPEAYEAYLRGRFHWNQFTPDSLVKAFEAFQAAIEIDPDYALAHVGLADSYIWASIYGMIPSAEAVPLAEKAALRAIELDDKLGEAYASLGLTNQNRFSWEKAIKLYEKSLELAPNYVHAHEWYAAQLVGHGDFEAGAKEMKIAERLDPLSLRTKTLTAWTLYQGHFYDEALERGRQIIYLDANYPQGYAQTGLNLLAMKRVEESLPYFQKFDAMIPDSVLAKYQLCFALVAAEREPEARKILEDVETLHAKGYVKPYFLAMTYAALDERDAALENFEKAFAEDDPWMLWFGTEPLLENMRGDRRFNDILRRMNNPLAKP